MKNFIVKVHETFTLNLPKIVDSDGDSFYTNWHVGLASTFVRYENDGLSLVIEPKSTKLSGDYPIALTITDIHEYPLNSVYTFTITV